MKEIVEKALREKQNIAIYSNSDDTTKFAYGRPLCMDDVDFALYLISPNGEYDGILVQEINEILYIERDEQYAQKMQTLCAEHRFPEIRLPSEAESVKTNILLYAKENKKVVALEVQYSGIDDITGFVETLENGLCTIKELDAFGQVQGTAYVETDRITQISCDSQNEQRILWLYANPSKE